MRKIISVFLVFALCLGPVLPPASAAEFRSFEKDLGHLADSVLRGVDSNVLIFMDVTNPMVMSLAGQLPIFRWQAPPNQARPDDEWMITNQPRMRDAFFRRDLLVENTFGIGARPISVGTMAQQAARLNNTNPPAGQMFVPPFTGTEEPNRGTGNLTSNHAGTRWGRDIDTSNNIIGHPDHYYSPDPARPFLLTFKDENWANWDGRGTPPRSRSDYRPFPFVNYFNQPMPAGLVARLPGGPMYGVPVTEPDLVRHLVPNDSKMYKLKLVMWRILAPNQDNFQMLARMRMGLATTFFEHGMNNAGAGLATLASVILHPHAANDSMRMWHSSSDSVPLAVPTAAVPLIHGAADAALMGFQSPTVQASSVVRATAFGGVALNLRETVRGSRHAGRSLMRVPFDFMYARQEDGTFTPTESLIAFRELIDGIEQINRSANVAFVERFTNMELTPTGLVHTAERKMFGRGERGDNWLIDDAGRVQLVVGGGGPAPVGITPAGSSLAISYATGARGSRTGVLSNAQGFRPDGELVTGASTMNRGVVMRRVETSEGFMSGTAIGDVLDFFSPHPSVLPFQAGAANGSGDTRGFFPVTGSCQHNWIIYFSTGSENFPGWTGGPEETGTNRSMMRTLMDLHYESQVMRGRMWDGKQWVEAHHSMDNPIRTIVVGLVSTEGMHLDGDPYDRVADRTLPTASRLRNSIRRMAHAGQPTAVRNAQGRIVSLTPDKSIEPIFAENTEELLAALFAALNSIQSGDLAAGAPIIQPEVDGVRDFPVMLSASYMIDSSRQWRGSLTKTELQPIGAVPPSIPAPLWVEHGGGPRADAGLIMYAHRRTRGDRLWTMDRGGRTVLLNSLETNEISSLFGILNHHPAPNVPTEFKNWLINYDGDGSGVLGDMENSVPRFVPETATSRIDHSVSPPRMPPMRIYLQTNRGVVHSIDFATGQEMWAFIPPMAQNPYVRDKRFTDGGNVFLTDDLEMSSRAMRILDGMLTFRDVINGRDQPRTYMLGAMGLGGSGFYMMDITDPTDRMPQFLWGIANPRYGTPTNPADVHRWGAASVGNAIRYNDYVDLGFTIAAPVIRRIEDAPNYVGILPGGLGYNLGDNDTQGRAFFVFDINNGEIIRTISNSNLGSYIPPPGVSQADARLGMGIAPIYFVNNMDGPLGTRDGGTLREFFTGDSEGNVLHSGVVFDSTASPPVAIPAHNWTLRSIFRARNLERGSERGLGGPIAMPLSYSISTRGAQRWLFSGTSNITAPGGRELRNDEQYIFALRLNNHPAYSDSRAAPLTLAALGGVEREQDADDPSDPEDNTGPFIGVNDYGWRMRLRPQVAGEEPRDPEYVSVTPFLFDGVLLVATFTPHTWIPGGDRERCAATGDGRLYALDPATGASMWRNGAQSLRFRDTKIVGLSIFRGNLFVAVEEMATGAASLAFSAHEETSEFSAHGSGVFELQAGVIRRPPPPGNGDNEWEPNRPHQLFWREEIIR